MYKRELAGDELLVQESVMEIELNALQLRECSRDI